MPLIRISQRLLSSLSKSMECRHDLFHDLLCCDRMTLAMG